MCIRPDIKFNSQIFQNPTKKKNLQFETTDRDTRQPDTDPAALAGPDMAGDTTSSNQKVSVIFLSFGTFPFSSIFIVKIKYQIREIVLGK